MTISDVKMQLSTIEEKTRQHDEAFKHLEEALQHLQRSQTDGDHGLPKQKPKSHKSPRGLSACVRKVHAALEDDKQYHADERVNSDHNRAVTERIIEQVLAGKDYSSKQDISYAAKKYHEYLVRQDKPIPEAQKTLSAKNNRIIQRRQRLYERRMKYAVHHEVAVMQKLSEKYMSNEETDSEDHSTFIRRSPGWRSTALNKLIAKLDQKYSRKKDSSKPAKKRIDGALSNRTPPTNAPRWAVVREVSTSESASTTPTDDDQYSEVTDSGENNSSQISIPDRGENSMAINSSPTSIADGGGNSMVISSSPTSINDSGENSTSMGINSSPITDSSRPTNNRTSSDHDDESEDEDLNEIFQAVIGTTSTC